MATDKRLVPKLRFKEFKISSDWEKCFLKDISNIVGGGTPSTGTKEYWNGTINWYSPTEIGGSVYTSKSVKKITKLGLKRSSAQLLPKHKTILFTSRAGIGDMAILKEDSATNQGFQSIIVNDNIDVYFIFSMRNNLKKLALKKASGSTFLEISGNKLKEIPLIIPSYIEQVEIGRFFRNIDNLVSLQQQKITKLKNLKAAYLNDMFPKEGENVPKLRFAGFEKKWETSRLSNFGDFESNGVNKKINENEQFVNLLNYMDVYNRKEIDKSNYRDLMIVTAPQRKILDRNIEANDVFITPSSETPEDIGRVLVIKENLPNTVYSYHLVRYRPHEYIFYKNFLDFGLSNAFVREQFILAAQGVQRYVINSSGFEEILAKFPSFKEQKAITLFFNNLDQQIKVQEDKLDKLNKMKQAYLNEMFV